MTKLGLKIDIDTEMGTRIGVPNLLKLFDALEIKATFLFSLGPDNTGRALKRIFRPGFFKKVSRTSVLQVYGLKTICNGLLWPGPHIAKKHADLMKSVRDAGHEVGIHCYDHIYWQDKLHTLDEATVRHEVNKTHELFKTVFGFLARTMGAAGWQASKHSLAAYDDHNLLYASDTRGEKAFYPVAGRRTFTTLQIPTTLPTLDELLGRPEYPFETLHDHYLSLIQPDKLNVLTLHAELEGMAYLEWFEAFLRKCLEGGITIVPLQQLAVEILARKEKIPTLPLIQGNVDGRSGTLAMHG
ncbi:MAG: 4-deoxy-4-formamido-L-arabinose-phosphoundecaprenol deformylase [Alphaproteobacteria bacterium]|nr:4-deoxy-4-formamido-L-arabinose-phosphoundecaprenol deformylase [Alphaproteobacteria bacterium]